MISEVRKLVPLTMLEKTELPTTESRSGRGVVAEVGKDWIIGVGKSEETDRRLTREVFRL